MKRHSKGKSLGTEEERRSITKKRGKGRQKRQKCYWKADKEGSKHHQLGQMRRHHGLFGFAFFPPMWKYAVHVRPEKAGNVPKTMGVWAPTWGYSLKSPSWGRLTTLGPSCSHYPQKWMREKPPPPYNKGNMGLLGGGTVKEGQHPPR